MRWLVGPVMVFCVLGGIPPDSAAQTSRSICVENLRDSVRSAAQSRKLPGLQYALMHRDGGLVEIAVGEASPDTPLTVAQPMRIASLSKVLTGLAALEADRSGLLPLDSHLVDALGLPRKTVSDGAGSIRIRDLLAHRSGLARTDGIDEMLRAEPRCPGRSAEVLARPLSRPPGERFEYSNTGYCLVGEALSNVRGTPFADVVGEMVKRHIGASTIRMHDGRSGAVRYHPSPDDASDDPARFRFNYEAMLASGGFESTATDLARLINRGFDEKSLQRLDIAPEECRRLPGRRNCHGLIFHVERRLGDPAVFWRDGSLPGSTALAAITADGAWTWVALSNQRHANWLAWNEGLLQELDQGARTFERCIKTQGQITPGMKR